jgi:hypothetical protein
MIDRRAGRGPRAGKQSAAASFAGSGPEASSKHRFQWMNATHIGRQPAISQQRTKKRSHEGCILVDGGSVSH